MASPVLDRGTEHDAAPVRIVVVSRRGWVNRTLLYVPRFARHLRRRMRAGMSLSSAWRSARVRMLDYR
jgi:hypothetical protein